MPDGSTTVVTTSQTETIKDVVTRLLDKRALRYSNYDVLILATDEVCAALFMLNESIMRNIADLMDALLLFLHYNVHTQIKLLSLFNILY